ncbi:MAG: murein peptide amidase A [Magnetococcales bacterium]|nr:murein peptide amidase A [Magnetococcales bacterium]
MVHPPPKPKEELLSPLTIQDALQVIVEQAADQSNIPNKTIKRNRENTKNLNATPRAIKRRQREPAKTLSTEEMCHKIGAKLGSVDEQGCLAEQFSLTDGRSVEGLPILIKEFPPVEGRRPQARILLLGGIHGDEYSSISVVFKWLRILEKHHTGLFHWRIAPLVNPDGLLRDESQRMNANNVDLNRNFPTASTHQEWLKESREYWVEKTHRDPRRYPGPAPLSEPESRWVAEEIERFKPHAVVSIHAPFGLLDFDGPPTTPPEKLGQLYLSLLGTYPGSLGRYAGSIRKVPIITIELKYAGIMPSQEEVNSIWKDLVRWLVGHVKDRRPSDPVSMKEGEEQQPKSLLTWK